MEKQKIDDNIVLIGVKDIFKYVKAVGFQLIEKKNENVILKARGKFTAKAIDIFECTKRSIGDICGDISTNTVLFKNKDGKEVRVSEIQIIIKMVK